MPTSDLDRKLNGVVFAAELLLLGRRLVLKFTEKSGSNFCDQCHSFDIRLSRFMGAPGREVPVAPIVYIGTSKEAEERSYCPLCRLLFKAC